ncbi:DUF4981 domain-containing protein [Streptomyces sp. NPDC052301]|uniref:DUF4981 domain-containing protein n=1 Tax=Streptomyces sp. NPDC052301 TaxID=3365687 RepID=UPI0037CF1070
MSDGTPGGRLGAGPYTGGVAASGRRRVYGDFGEPVHRGPFGAGEAASPGRTSTPVRRGQREHAAPVRIRCFRHEGIVVTNHRRRWGLGGLTGTWELSLADGRTLTAPAELPDLRPGETAAVPLPLELPKDGGEAWLTLRVVTAEGRPWVPPGTEVCAPRIRLRAAAAVTGRGTDGPPVKTDGRGPVRVLPVPASLTR